MTSLSGIQSEKMNIMNQAEAAILARQTDGTYKVNDSIGACYLLNRNVIQNILN